MQRKYLNELNVKNRPDLWNPDDERQKFWQEQREEYGFDKRETWSLDRTFYLWLYERLKTYLECAAVDLNYHIFNYKGIVYTQKQLINMMIERLEPYL